MYCKQQENNVCRIAFGMYTVSQKSSHFLTICNIDFLFRKVVRWGGYCRMCFVANFMRFPAVQKNWRSVKIWQSYGEFKSENFLRHSVYTDIRRPNIPC